MAKHQDEEALKQHYHGRGMAIGMLLFMPFGAALWLTTGNPGFLGVGPAMGLAVGLAIGESMYQRQEHEETR